MLEQADISNQAESRGEPPFLRIPGDAAGGCLLICDHATNLEPHGHGALGLPPDQMQRHIAYDIGAAGVTAALSELMRAPAVLANYSRLFIDPNRGEDDPTLVMRLSDGAVIPGNAKIDEVEVERRRARYYDPYHAAIDAALDEAIAAGQVPVILSIHTFTDVWRGRPRPWHGAVLWDRDPRLARPLIAALSREEGLIIGDNEPYTGKLTGDCLYKHGTHRGLAHALIEIRQDLVRDESGQQQWAARLARAMESAMSAPGAAQELHTIEFYGSCTDDPPDRGDGGKGPGSKG